MAVTTTRPSTRTYAPPGAAPAHVAAPAAKAVPATSPTVTVAPRPVQPTPRTDGAGALKTLFDQWVEPILADVDTLKKHDGQLQAQVGALQQEVQSLQASLDSKVAAATADIRKEIAAARECMKKQDHLLAAQAEDIARLRGKASTQEDRLRAQGKEIAALKQGMAEHGEALARHEALLQDNTQRLQKHEQRLDQHDSQLSAHDRLLAEHRERLRWLETTVAGLGQRVTALELSRISASGPGWWGDGWPRLPICAGPGAAGDGPDGAPGGACPRPGGSSVLPALTTASGLAGRWAGHYGRKDSGVSVPFSLDLTQRGSALVGTSSEPVTVNGIVADSALAHVLGQTWAVVCDGHARQMVGFSAIYAGTGGMLGPTLHLGTREGERLAGRWYWSKAGRWVEGGGYELIRQA